MQDEDIKADVAAALAGNPHAKAAFEALTPEQRAEKLAWVEQSEAPEIRMRRLSLLIEQLTQAE